MRQSDCKFFSAFLFLRLLSVFIIQSSFVPDEYWQSLEVSHKMTFGYGHLTWEWDRKIRSCAYPFIIHLIFNILPDSPMIVIYAPKFLQAILSAVGDLFAYKLALDYFGKECALWTVLNTAISWFLFYCAPRTITNMAEATLTTVGFYFYPWPKSKIYGKSSSYLWFAGASAVFRPTAIVTWFPLFIWHVCREQNKRSIIEKTVIIGCILLTAMLLIDRWCYGEWVFTHYNFFLLNWTCDIGALYGSHPFLWYFCIGLPVVLGIQLLPFLGGLFLPKLRTFYFLIFWVMLVFSIPSHKEFRFLLPVIHLSLIICGAVMNEVWSGKLFKKCIIHLSILMILINIPLIVYMGLFHQRGVIDVALHLSKTVDTNSSVLFLMPCHSTPYYSYIHKNIKMKFLTCEPNFANKGNYIDEADGFFEQPLLWLTENYAQRNLPSHIVLFDSLYHRIEGFLSKHSYYECYSTFHSHFYQARAGKFVNIFCK